MVERNLEQVSLLNDALRTTAAAARRARGRAVKTVVSAARRGKQRLRLARYLVSGEASVDDGYALSILASLEPRHDHVCPVCGFAGRFLPFGLPPRPEARCPCCGALERHRLLAHVDRTHHILTDAKALLHFAPEPLLAAKLRRTCLLYVSADIADPAADIHIDIENMDIPDGTFDTVLCSHVLEHVDDRRALAEIHRVLVPGGRLVAMVPLAEGCGLTYENPKVRDPRARELHFGQSDHVRRYGADFRDRVHDAGFAVREFTAEGEDAIRYGFMFGEKVFVCERT
ncbi:MAG: methyltransferase domain-containing protein [Alphaproteobacteria bacterium]